jgi:hypothetical protein
MADDLKAAAVAELAKKWKAEEEQATAQDAEEDSAADEHIARAHDALFAGDLGAAERASRDAVAAAPRDTHAHAMLVFVLRDIGDAVRAVVAARAWGAACGPSAKQLLALAEAAFLASDTAALADAARAMAALPSKGPTVGEPMALYSRCAVASIVAAAAVADSSLRDAPEAVLAACEGLEVDEGYETVIETLAAYADLRNGVAAAQRREAALGTLRRVGESGAASDSEYEKAVARLARALLVLDALDTTNPAAARDTIAKMSPPLSRDDLADANIASVLALIEAKEGAATAAIAERKSAIPAGANIIFIKRVAML